MILKSAILLLTNCYISFEITSWRDSLCNANRYATDTHIITTKDIYMTSTMIGDIFLVDVCPKIQYRILCHLYGEEIKLP